MAEKDFATWIKKSKGSMPKEGTSAGHTEWFDIGTIEFASKVLHVGDRWYHSGDDDPQVKITPGEFRVQAKGAEFGPHRRVAAVRVFADGIEPKRGKSLGEVDVDSWGVLIGDLVDLYRDIADEAAREKWWNKNLFGKYAKSVEIVNFKVGSRSLPFVTAFSGLGSGGYAVHTVVARGKTVGVEIEFIEAGLEA